MVLAVLLIGIGFFASLASAVTALFVGTFLIGFVIAPVARVGLLHCTNELLTVRSLIRELNETIDRCGDVDLP